jgi:DNA-binding NarL/FixJ family response regulator
MRFSRMIAYHEGKSSMSALLQQALPRGPGRSVVIVGRRNVQSGLMAFLLQQQLGCACEIRALDQLDDVPVATDALTLVDVDGMPTRDVAACVARLMSSGRYRGVALVNVDEADVDSLVFPGIKGVFFRDASQGHLLKGIRAIFNGEYWLPRRVLALHFDRAQRRGFTANGTGLTPKEAETLMLLVRGDGNNDIARRLGVSPHTVKTHIYHVFRKLGVNNRVQAVNWAAAHAENLDRDSS